MNTELPRNTIYITVQKFAGRKIFCNTLYISAMPSFVKIIVNKTPAAHHGEVCKVSSSAGNYRSQYITISSSFTDAFLPSSLHSNTRHLALRLLCCRKCLIVGMFLAVAVAVTSLCLSKR